MTGSGVGAVVEYEPHLEARPRSPDSSSNGVEVILGPGSRSGAPFSQAVPGDDGREWQFFVHPADQLDRYLGRTGYRQPQAREVEVGALGMVENRLVEGG